MRIALSAIVVLLGVNLLIDLMDSNLVNIIEERNQTINRILEWRPNYQYKYPVLCYFSLKKVFLNVSKCFVLCH